MSTTAFVIVIVMEFRAFTRRVLLTTDGALFVQPAMVCGSLCILSVEVDLAGRTDGIGRLHCCNVAHHTGVSRRSAFTFKVTLTAGSTVFAQPALECSIFGIPCVHMDLTGRTDGARCQSYWVTTPHTDVTDEQRRSQCNTGRRRLTRHIDLTEFTGRSRLLTDGREIDCQRYRSGHCCQGWR